MIEIFFPDILDILNWLYEKNMKFIEKIRWWLHG